MVSDTGEVLAVDVGGTKLAVGRVDHGGRVVRKLHVPTPRNVDAELVLIAHLTKSGIKVERRYGELPRVECHPNQINQVLMNLCVNACQAMGDRGTLTITTRPLGEAVEVRIQDTGVGIARDKLSRIFDPGFTTKGAPLGTGLGLSIVYQIVEGHGGDIAVESEPGTGTAFTIRLPVRHTISA